MALFSSLLSGLKDLVPKVTIYPKSHCELIAHGFVQNLYVLFMFSYLSHLLSNDVDEFPAHCVGWHFLLSLRAASFSSIKGCLLGCLGVSVR